MSRIQTSSDFGKVDPETLQRYLSIALTDIVNTINGNLEFDLNLRSKTLVGVVFDTADTETAVAHGMGRTPHGYFVVASDAATSLYNSTDSDSTNLYLKSSAIATVTIIAF